MRSGLFTMTTRAAGWLVVVVVATATAIGLVDRIFRHGTGDYLLVSEEVRRHPFGAALILLVCLVLYGWVFRWLGRVLDGWRDGAEAALPADGERFGRLARLVTYLFARWWRISIALFVVWLPIYATSWPGQANLDFVNAVGEFLLRRSDFTGGAVISPLDDYPTSSYLLTPGDGMWSNHHNFYLMLYYGSVAWLSLHWFDSFAPGLAFLSSVCAVFTLVAFGRAFAILGRFVTSWRVRAIGLGLVVASPLIGVWSLSHSKNQLFAAALVWWLALLAERLHGDAGIRRTWYAEALLTSVVIAVSVLFGWMMLLAQAIALLVALVLARRRWLLAPLMLILPALAVHYSVAFFVAQGDVIASDPIETKSVQLRQLALVLREHPDTLSEADRAALSRLFRIDVLAAVYDPDNVDPLKSTGRPPEKTDAYRYDTVTAADWTVFDGIWWRAISAHPATALDATVQKTYRYLDPLDKGTTWYPPWLRGFTRSVGDHQIAPTTINRMPRSFVREAAYGCYNVLPCRPLLSHSLRTVAVVLFAAAAVAVRRRYAWFWALPFALNLGIDFASPLSAGGRYALPFTYGLGVLVMILAIADGASESRRRSTGTPGS